jgi:protein phosphatase 1 regulatory subunit 37
MPFDCCSHLAEIISPDNRQTSTPTHLPFPHTRTLSHLDLRDNDLRHGMTDLCRALSHADILTHLNLRENKLDSGSLLALSDALRLNTKLINLNLSSNVLESSTRTGDANALLKEALMVNKTLKYLSMAGTEMSSVTAIAIAEALPANSGGGLERLDLRGNRFDIAGVMALSVALKLNQSILTLDIVPMASAHHIQVCFFLIYRYSCVAIFIYMIVFLG